MSVMFARAIAVVYVSFVGFLEISGVNLSWAETLLRQLRQYERALAGDSWGHVLLGCGWITIFLSQRQE